MTDVSFVEKVVKQVKRLLARDGMHPGMIIDYAGENPPEGWLWCDGSEVSRAEYPALFKAIGTKWGAGDGSTTFNLPDSRKRVREGANNISEVGQKVEAGLPDIIGSFGAIVPDKHSSYRSGAFASATISESSDDAFVVSGHTKRDAVYGYSLRAAWSSSVFGKSATNQSNALRFLAIIKI